MAVVIETTLGDFTVDLFTEERPQTCKNFLKLCKIKYYNFCLFHSIQANFLAQTGDPTGSGTGGESIFGIIYGEKARYYEAEKLPKLKHSKPGLLSMVNCGNNMLGSQFFLTLGSELQSLDEHCIFAEITEGMDILLKLNEAICDNQHRPYKDIRITHTVILEDPFEDPSGLVVPDASPEPSQLTLQNGRIGADEEIDETAGMTTAEVEEMKQSREAQARATILEIVGDLPDAEMAPPENVLFVCKLNPVTTDDDLEIIFSRFGKVKSCEVIRDHETGDSLQYAFIEFEDQKACEEAYFKMDNVLIDDRRIHVDFSQSVAKMRWRGKGKGIEYFDKNDKDKNKEKDKDKNNQRLSFDEHKNSTRRENYRDNREDSFRDNRVWNHRKRQDDERLRKRGENESRRTDKRKFDDCRKSDDRRRQESFKKWEGNQRNERRKGHDDRRSYSHNSRTDTFGRRDDKKETDSRKKDMYHRDDRSRESRYRSNSRNRSHSTEQYNDKKQVSPHVGKLKENGVVEEKTVSSKSGFSGNKEKNENGDLLTSSLITSSEVVEIKTGEDRVSIKLDIEEDPKLNTSKPCEMESPMKEPSKQRESSIISEKKLKRKRSVESKPRKKRKDSTTSDSSSLASDSSNSSSSSESASSEDYKHRHKRKTTVATKYYHRGKLVKVVKKKKDTSESESFSDSSDSDRKRKKQKGRKHRTKKIVKIIQKRFDSSDDSDSDSTSSDESESDRSRKKKIRKMLEKKKKKKKSSLQKKHKRTKSEGSSVSDSDEKHSSHKKKKNKKESNCTQTSD